MKMARKHVPIQTIDMQLVSSPNFFRKKGKIGNYLAYAFGLGRLFTFWSVVGIAVFSDFYSALQLGAMITIGTYGLYGLSQISRKKQGNFLLTRLFDPKKIQTRKG
jgi:hypothetical protein